MNFRTEYSASADTIVAS